MNHNSLSAFFDKGNQKTFKSHKAKIVRELSKHPLQHTHQIATKLNLSNEQINKRLSDSDNSDIFEVKGNTTYRGNTIALYKLKDQLSIFPIEKKITLPQWLKKEYPHIHFEFKAMQKHEL